MLLAATGIALIYNLAALLGILLCLGLLYALTVFVVGKLGGPPFARTGVDILFAIVVVVILIAFIVSLIRGEPWITAR